VPAGAAAAVKVCKDACCLKLVLRLAVH
jgi:hypothetical protein